MRADGLSGAGEVTPDKKLWQAVVFQAAVDATQTDPKSTEARRNKQDADAWFRGNGRNFKEVCSNAGMDPDFISGAYIAGRIERERLKSAGTA